MNINPQKYKNYMNIYGLYSNAIEYWQRMNNRNTRNKSDIVKLFLHGLGFSLHTSTAVANTVNVDVVARLSADKN